MLEGQEHEIKKLDFREDRLASTSRDMSVWLWDEEWDCVSTLTTQGDTKCVKFVESTGLIVGGFDGFLRIFSED
jgi:WD40 repeat protein